MTVTITVEREVEVEIEYTPACRGARDSCGGVRGAGPPLEPDTPASWEFVKATLDGMEIELTRSEIKEAEQQAREEGEE
jgi:hypothetical protein